ncbi:hypothetical protein LCGC14_2594080 [marine sediment metagenome]|uniref:Uncharacterized protein n=1 Tax=marine sediment metagenome TaxID=412755 RepID=A0A0F9AAQ2_9ZZZZ
MKVIMKPEYVNKDFEARLMTFGEFIGADEIIYIDKDKKEEYVIFKDGRWLTLNVMGYMNTDLDKEDHTDGYMNNKVNENDRT